MAWQLSHIPGLVSTFRETSHLPSSYVLSVAFRYVNLHTPSSYKIRKIRNAFPIRSHLGKSCFITNLILVVLWWWWWRSEGSHGFLGWGHVLGRWHVVRRGDSNHSLNVDAHLTRTTELLFGRVPWHLEQKHFG